MSRPIAAQTPHTVPVKKALPRSRRRSSPGRVRRPFVESDSEEEEVVVAKPSSSRQMAHKSKGMDGVEAQTPHMLLNQRRWRRRIKRTDFEREGEEEEVAEPSLSRQVGQKSKRMDGVEHDRDVIDLTESDGDRPEDIQVQQVIELTDGESEEDNIPGHQVIDLTQSDPEPAAVSESEDGSSDLDHLPEKRDQDRWVAVRGKEKYKQLSFKKSRD